MHWLTKEDITLQTPEMPSILTSYYSTVQTASKCGATRGSTGLPWFGYGRQSIEQSHARGCVRRKVNSTLSYAQF